MKRSTMIRGLAALAVCALLPVVMASQKNPVPRPFKMQAHSQMVVSLVDYSISTAGVSTNNGFGDGAPEEAWFEAGAGWFWARTVPIPPAANVPRKLRVSSVPSISVCHRTEQALLQDVRFQP